MDCSLCFDTWPGFVTAGATHPAATPLLSSPLLSLSSTWPTLPKSWSLNSPGLAGGSVDRRGWSFSVVARIDAVDINTDCPPGNSLEDLFRR